MLCDCDTLAEYAQTCIQKLSAENKQLKEENEQLQDELEDLRDLCRDPGEPPV